MRNKLRGVLVVLAVVGALGMVSCAPATVDEPSSDTAPAAPASEQHEWKLQTLSTTAMRHYVAATRIAQRITDMSGGRLTVEVYPSGAVVPSTQELQEGVEQGVIEACVAGHMNQLNLFPAAGLFDQVSGGMTSLQFQMWYLVGGGNQLAARLYEPLQNSVYVGLANVDPQEIFCHSTKKLDSLEDLKGLKFRTAGDGALILGRLGVSVVTLPGQELYEAAQRGVIDAFEYGGPAVNWNMGFQEVSDYLYLSPVRAPTSAKAFFVNADAWEALSPDLKGIVKVASQAEALEWYGEEITLDYGALGKYTAYGNEVINLPQEIVDAFVAEATTFFDERADADPFAKEVIESQRVFKEICVAQDIG